MILRSSSINYNFLNSVSIIFLMHKFTLFNCKGDIFKELVFPSEEFTKAYMHMLAEARNFLIVNPNKNRQNRYLKLETVIKEKNKKIKQ